MNGGPLPRLLLCRIAELEKFLGNAHSPWWTKSKWINRGERLRAHFRDFKSWLSYHRGIETSIGDSATGLENSAASGPEGSSSAEIENSSTLRSPGDLENVLSQ